MDSAEIVAELKRLRVPHDRIAAVINRDRTAATKMLNGSRSVKANEIQGLEALIREFRQHDDEAAPGLAEPSPPPYLHELGEPLHIRGEVRAGAWLQENLLDQREPTTHPVAPDPRYPKARQWLSRVRGDSMNALTRDGRSAGIFDGDLVHLVDTYAIDYVPATGDVVEVERTRFGGAESEITLKQVEVLEGGRVLLWPRSANPAWHEPIAYEEGDQENTTVRIRGKMLQLIRPF